MCSAPSTATADTIEEDAAKLATQARQHIALIRRYVAACNAADADTMRACLAPDAAHYFPPGLPGVPWVGAETICRGWIGCAENLGSHWTIERIVVSHEAPEAVVEWTHWTAEAGPAQRGTAWYVFDEASGLIREVRAYHAAPAVQGDAPIGELAGFDYAGRGYHLSKDG